MYWEDRGFEAQYELRVEETREVVFGKQGGVMSVVVRVTRRVMMRRNWGSSLKPVSPHESRNTMQRISNRIESFINYLQGPSTCKNDRRASRLLIDKIGILRDLKHLCDCSRVQLMNLWELSLPGCSLKLEIWSLAKSMSSILYQALKVMTN